jgi:hypothetical protein
MDWVSGQGARIVGSFGASTSELVALRVSEADTAEGIGIYSRFAAGAKQGLRLGELSASLVYVRIFDRDESVPSDQQLVEPLVNNVYSGILGLGGDGRSMEIEVAHSDARGPTDSDGEAYRVRGELGESTGKRVSLEYIDSESSYYSAGSLEVDPGENGLELEFAYGSPQRVLSSGSVGVFRSRGGSYGLAEGEYKLELYGRTDVSWTTESDYLRTYVIGRYMSTPYELYDHIYSYAALGGSWRLGRARGSVGTSYGRTRSPGRRDTYSAGGDVRFAFSPTPVSGRLDLRWTLGTSTDGDTDYTRVSYLVEASWAVGVYAITGEYRLVDREDRSVRDESYTEHVVRLSVGRTF